MKRIMMVGLVCALAMLAASAALATQVIERTPQQLAQESTLIVEGKVAGVRSFWNGDHTRIYSEATVAVASTYKGRGGSTVRVVQPGGVVGNVRMTAQGAVTWKRGEEVLLFLEPSTPGAFQVAGFSQGKYEVQRDARGRAFVQRALPTDGGENATATKQTVAQFISEVLPHE